ncbi:MAG: hypothetical protein ACTHQ3_15900 [Motilibacteraceae bacterium]
MSENLRDRYAAALHKAFEDADDRLEGEPSVWALADAVLAVRDDVLAEKDAEIERLREVTQQQPFRVAESNRLRRLASEAEVARLRETVGRVEALADSLVWKRPDKSPCGPDYCCGSEAACQAMMPSVRVVGHEEIRAALAPRESATEAPRTRDGEQCGFKRCTLPKGHDS